MPDHKVNEIFGTMSVTYSEGAAVAYSTQSFAGDSSRLSMRQNRVRMSSKLATSIAPTSPGAKPGVTQNVVTLPAKHLVTLQLANIMLRQR